MCLAKGHTGQWEIQVVFKFLQGKESNLLSLEKETCPIRACQRNEICLVTKRQLMM